MGRLRTAPKREEHIRATVSLQTESGSMMNLSRKRARLGVAHTPCHSKTAKSMKSSRESLPFYHRSQLHLVVKGFIAVAVALMTVSLKVMLDLSSSADHTMDPLLATRLEMGVIPTIAHVNASILHRTNHTHQINTTLEITQENSAVVHPRVYFIPQSDDQNGPLLLLKNRTITEETKNHRYNVHKHPMRNPYHNMSMCAPLFNWQTTFHPTCNSIHEIDLASFPDDDRDESVQKLGSGGWRMAWKIPDEQHERDSSSVVLKTIKEVDGYFDPATYKRHTIDAMVSEHLTKSPHILDIFGHCAHAVLNEFATGSLRTYVRDKEKKAKSEAKAKAKRDRKAAKAKAAKAEKKEKADVKLKTESEANLKSKFEAHANETETTNAKINSRKRRALTNANKAVEHDEKKSKRDPQAEIEPQNATETTTFWPLSSLEALQLATQIAQGLADVHGMRDRNQPLGYNRSHHYAQVVYKDLKPSNILVSTDGRLKIGDFNDAELVQWNTTSQEPCTFRRRRWTPTYHSPEEVWERPLTEKIDIFAFGGILYYLLVGQDPYHGKSIQALLKATALNIPPTFPNGFESRIKDPVTAYLLDVFKWCHVKKPKNRPPAEALALEMTRKYDIFASEKGG